MVSSSVGARVSDGGRSVTDPAERRATARTTWRPDVIKSSLVAEDEVPPAASTDFAGWTVAVFAGGDGSVTGSTPPFLCPDERLMTLGFDGLVVDSSDAALGFGRAQASALSRAVELVKNVLAVPCSPGNSIASWSTTGDKFLLARDRIPYGVRVIYWHHPEVSDAAAVGGALNRLRPRGDTEVVVARHGGMLPGFETALAALVPGCTFETA